MGTSQNPASGRRGFSFNALNLFHLLTSSFRAERAKRYNWNAAQQGIFLVVWVCRGVKVVVWCQDNDELWSWSSYLRLGSTCVALHLDYNESFSGLRHTACFLTTEWKPQEAITGWS